MLLGDRVEDAFTVNRSELAQHDVAARLQVPRPHIPIATECADPLVLFDKRQLTVFSESNQGHGTFRCVPCEVDRFEELPREVSSTGFARTLRSNRCKFLGFLDPSARTVRCKLGVVVSKQPETSLSVQITFLVTGSLHALSFPRARPTALMLLDTIRRSAQSSSSGLPQRKRTYLPKRTCGMGSVERDRTCSRIHDSGRPQRAASSLLSMNSYRLSDLKVSVALSPSLSLSCISRFIKPQSTSSGKGLAVREA